MAQQTAIEWLLEQIHNQKIEFIITDMGILISQKENILEQAKQMEKEQIMKAHGGRSYSGFDSSGNFFIRQTTGEEYYNETYGI